MKKLFFLCMVCCCICYHAMADHIKGGEIFYTCTSVSGNNYTYNITAKLYMICTSTRKFNDPTYVSFFNRATNARVLDMQVPLAKIEVLQLDKPDPCVINPPDVCSRIGYYNFSITLPASAEGYTISTQITYRVDNMLNLTPGYDRVGAMYIGSIPGTNTGNSSPRNNSARFIDEDEVIICAGNYFTYSFGAQDSDNDKLRYYFCDALQVPYMQGVDQNIRPPQPPPYLSVPYASNYSGSQPLGNGISIDANTGVISGIAPASGTYVISVCVDEIRNGVVIATQHKDLQISIASCIVVSARLPDSIKLCGDTKTASFSNLSATNSENAYSWQFYKADGTTIYTSADLSPAYTFADTGIYKVKLVINNSGTCADSATSKVFVYPGFKAAFDYSGECFNKPTLFTDATSTQYGIINSWQWNFNDGNNNDNTSSIQNPSHTFTALGNKYVQLIVSSSKGCVDTTSENVAIISKPVIQLAFRDTVICITNALQLHAAGNGSFSWLPATNITGANTNAPTVTPKITTVYNVDLDDNGCTNHDSIIVHVIDHVSVNAMSDTTICSGDVIQLHIISDALKYSWSPVSQITNANTQNPFVTTNQTTTYNVTASRGSCKTTAQIQVNAVPYPKASAGTDTAICYQTTAQLHGITNGNAFTWLPQTSLQFANTLNPVANITSTTSYILTAYNNNGCPKPGIDTVIITVLPPIKAFAGNDTSVVINQPLQFNASGGSIYSWKPDVGLSATNIANPVGLYTTPSEGITYTLLTSNAAGCSDSASVTVRVYKVLPSVFVPSAFTPNNDGLNDVLKPVAVGMQRIEFFAVYNRWGQMIFKTSGINNGWDGTINGTLQTTATYVWMFKAVDYTGKPYFQKGTVTLIR